MRYMIAIFDMQNTENAVNIVAYTFCGSHKMWIAFRALFDSIEVNFVK